MEDVPTSVSLPIALMTRFILRHALLATAAAHPNRYVCDTLSPSIGSSALPAVQLNGSNDALSTNNSFAVAIAGTGDSVSNSTVKFAANSLFRLATTRDYEGALDRVHAELLMFMEATGILSSGRKPAKPLK